MAAPDNKSLLFLVLKFLNDSNLTDAARALERETCIFFNMKYFEELMVYGAYDEAEEYFSSFSDIHDNIFSTKVFFEIRKHKFLETLHGGHFKKARYILQKEIKETFAQYNEQMVREAETILEQQDLMAGEILTGHGDLMAARMRVMTDIKKCIEINPIFSGCLATPTLNTSLQRLASAPPPVHMVSPGTTPPLPSSI